MKQSLLFIILSIGLFGCKTKTGTTAINTDTSTKINFPFTPKYSINWQKGDEHNALIVLNTLKKYVAGNVKGAMESMADTVTFIGDNFYFNGKKDSLETILA